MQEYVREIKSEAESDYPKYIFNKAETNNFNELFNKKLKNEIDNFFDIFTTEVNLLGFSNIQEIDSLNLKKGEIFLFLIDLSFNFRKKCTKIQFNR